MRSNILILSCKIKDKIVKVGCVRQSTFFCAEGAVCFKKKKDERILLLSLYRMTSL